MKYGVSTGIPQLPANKADKDFALVQPLYSAINSLAQAVSLATGLVEFDQAELAQRNQLNTILTQNHRIINLYAPAALAYGKLINIYIDSGKLAARYADATDATKPCHGVVDAPLGISAGDYGRVLLIEGPTFGITGSTVGLYYFLGINGDAQAGAPTAAGSIVQPVGFGLGSAGFYLHVSSYIKQN